MIKKIALLLLIASQVFAGSVTTPQYDIYSLENTKNNTYRVRENFRDLSANKIDKSYAIDNYSNQSIAGNKTFTGTTTIEQEAWTAPTLLNSWVNYGGVYGSAGYYKDSFGIVHLRGLIKDGTVGLVAFTLPSGYRPVQYHAIAIASNDAFGRITIYTDGSVIPEPPCNNAWVSLDGISFRAE